MNIKITDEEVSREDKANLVAGVTSLLEKVLNKNPKTTVVIIDIVAKENWAINAKLLSKSV